MEASTTKKRSVELTLREAILPAKVSEWRAKLSAKAKQEKRYRFYSLYGLISHAETLKAAWQQVRANGGAAGVDGISRSNTKDPSRGSKPLAKNCERKPIGVKRCAESIFPKPMASCGHSESRRYGIEWCKRRCC